MLRDISTDNTQEIRDAVRSRLVMFAFTSVKCLGLVFQDLLTVFLSKATAWSSSLPKRHHEARISTRTGERAVLEIIKLIPRGERISRLAQGMWVLVGEDRAAHGRGATLKGNGL